MACVGEIIFQGESANVTVDQPVNVTFVITNLGGSDVTVSSLNVYSTSNGFPSAGTTFGVPTTRGSNVTVSANGGQLAYSFGVVFRSPQISAENQAAPTWASTTATVLSITTTFSDSSVLNVSETVTPSGEGAAAPAAAGQFIFSSPLNSPNFIFW